MIDTSKCEFEEYFFDEINNEGYYYFTYPKDLGLKERNFNIEFGEFVSCCLVVIVGDSEDPEDISVTIAATVSEDDGDSLSDVDWHDLFRYIDYKPNDIVQMLNNLNI